MTQFRISQPTLIDGIWHARAEIVVGSDVIRIQASAPQGFARRNMAGLSRYIEFGQPYASFGYEGSEVGCGCGSAPGVRGFDEAGGVFDNILNVVKSVADSPIVRAIPYVGTVATLASGAVDLYKGIKAGMPQAKGRLKRIRRDARAGNPQARQALAKLKAARSADMLRRQARGGSVEALQRMRAIGNGVAQQDVQAVEAAKMLERLEMQDQGHDELPEDALTHAYDPSAQEPASVAADIIGAIVQRQSLSARDRLLHAQLTALMRRPRTGWGQPVGRSPRG